LLGAISHNLSNELSDLVNLGERLTALLQVVIAGVPLSWQWIQRRPVLGGLINQYSEVIPSSSTQNPTPGAAPSCYSAKPSDSETRRDSGAGSGLLQRQVPGLSP